jgi:PAS domain-containing protein
MDPVINPDENDKVKSLAREKEISDKIINHSRSMISIINRDYVYEKVNSAFCNAHMAISNAIIGKTPGEVWGQDIFRNLIKNNIDLCFSGKTIKYEAVFDTPKSGRRHFEVTLRPISVDNGKITHLLAETFDINDLKLSEQAALEKDEQFKKFEANLPIGFIRCDTGGNILHANNAFLNIIECENETGLVNFNLRSFYPDDGFFEMQLVSLLECQSKTFGRISMRNIRGKEVPCRVSGFLTRNEAGVPAFVDFIIEDSSREMMLENRLIQAQKLETIGALAGGIAHDFNNILATISGYSEMLKEDLPVSSPSSEKISKIQRAVLKAQFLINQILTFSRQVEQEKIRVNVSGVLK